MSTRRVRHSLLNSGKWAGRLGFWLLVVAAFLGAAETTARIDDFLRYRVPILVAPDRERDLVIHDAIGIRGRPHGSYKQWRLNRFGFRNAEITALPSDNCIRIMALGASETFGLFESPGMEYPAQLGGILRRHGSCYEVVNAAVAGLTLRGIIRLWNAWAARFGSHMVLIYPTPAFYLGERPPQYPGSGGTTQPPGAPWWTSRMLERIRDRVEYPELVQRFRVQRALAMATQSRDTEWFFRKIPGDRLTQFTDDLRTLVQSVTSAGATGMLLTHATAFHNPPLPDELPALKAWRTVRPRATEGALLAFEDAARTATLSVAREFSIPVVDVAAHMNGRREWFAEDFLHFNEDGAGVVAELISLRIPGHQPTSRVPVVNAVQ